MAIRIPWDCYEVAFLFSAYEQVIDGADYSAAAVRLSETLRDLANRRGVSIDETYRNVNGIKMQLANVQYLFTDGKKGLSGASAMIRRMFELYKTSPTDYQKILKEAIRLASSNTSIEDAFFSYAKERIGFSPSIIAECLKKATSYCQLNQPLLGMTDVKTVRNVQQKIAEGKLLRFRYGKEAQAIRTVTHLYYTFIKSYREPSKELPKQKTAEGTTVSELETSSDTEAIDIGAGSENQTGTIGAEVDEKSSASPKSYHENGAIRQLAEDGNYDWQSKGLLLVDWANEASYAYTQPEAYEYKGVTRRIQKWGKLYTDLCTALFEDHREAFMGIMNGDIPGYNALSFADEQHKSGMRVARCFAPGYYLESNIDATTIVRRIRGLYRLFELGDSLRISYTHQSVKKSVPIPKKTGEEWIIHELRTKKIPYVDNRSVKGCLWIASDRSVPIALKEAENRGYRLRFKLDGCRAFPNRPVIWTKDQPQQPKPAVLPIGDSNLTDLDDFRTFLVQNRHLAERTAGNYWTSIHMIEDFIRRNGLPYSLVNAKSSDVQSIVDALMSRTDFVRMNDERHHQFGAAMAQYVSYLEKQDQTTESASKQKQVTLSDLINGNIATMEENASLSAEIRKRILSLVPVYFPHGIRPTSIIDINKLKRTYQTKFDEELPVDIDMVPLLMSGGLKSGEKVYFLSEDQKQSLRSLITDIIRSGHRVIYYSELFCLHGELFEACHIYESSLMQTVLQSILPEYIYKAEWMLADQEANEIEEITKAYGNDVILTYQQLKNRCPYLTTSVIKGTLSRSDRFVWSSPETYARVDFIELDQAEVSDIVNRILPLIREEGFFSLAQLPIEESCGLNPQVSSSAVRDAIFTRHMSDEFTRNGLIVKRPELRLSTYQLMETWLKGLDQVTLTEVEDYERELTGHHAVLGVVAASNTMVRIDHDHYVSDASIQFNVDAVDHAISLFAGNRIISITAITSYTSFPDVPGYIWNLYLVESFLRRFSKRFTIDGGPAQMSYVGGISSAERHFDSYEDRLAHAVIQDNVMLTEEAVGRYLTDRKYILRRSETVRKTLDRARILNEQRGDSSVRI